MVSFGPTPALDAICDCPRLEVVFEPAEGPPIVERGRFGFDGQASFYFMASRGSRLHAYLGKGPVPVRITPLDRRGRVAGETLDCEAERWPGGMLYLDALQHLQRKYWLLLLHTVFSRYIQISLRGHAAWMEGLKGVDLNKMMLEGPRHAAMAARAGGRCGSCDTAKASGHSFCSDCGAVL